MARSHRPDGALELVEDLSWNESLFGNSSAGYRWIVIQAEIPIDSKDDYRVRVVWGSGVFLRKMCRYANKCRRIEAKLGDLLGTVI